MYKCIPVCTNVSKCVELKGPILVPTLFLQHINELPDDIICNISIYADDTTLVSNCNQASDMWQQLELVSKLESHLRGDTEIRSVDTVFEVSFSRSSPSSLPYGIAWNTVAIPGLVLLAPTCCWTFTYCLSIRQRLLPKCSQFRSFL